MRMRYRKPLSIRPTAQGFVRVALAFAFALGLLTLRVAPLQSQEPPEIFKVQGDASLVVKGPPRRRGRLWQYQVPGRFSGEVQVNSDGMAQINRISIRMGDLTVSRGRREIRRFRCNQAITDGPVAAALDPAGNLVILPEAGNLIVVSFSERAADGSCPGAGDVSFLQASNNRPLSGWHDPTSDVFQLTGRFHTRYDDENIDIDIDLNGHYENRPPVAELGVEGEGIDRSQGGCPPITGINPPSTEANDPAGLRIYLQSNSRDPDDVSFQSDLVSTQWEHWIGTPVGPPAGEYRFLGHGWRVGPALFELGQHHTVILWVRDRAGAKDRALCSFFVADTTPPSITPPDPITPLCTVTDGATPRTSEPLRDFLVGDSAYDLTDPAPHRLPPRVDGIEVTEDTLFPLDETTLVSFRHRDRHGNVAEAVSSVKVVRKPVILDIGLGRGVRALRGDGRWATIKPQLEIGGPCGFSLVYLEAISSDGMEAPYELVRGAAFGSDDREFELLATPVKMPDGRFRQRTYELTWVGVDTAGRKTRVVERLVIQPIKPK